jgi:hypothetical protein
MKFIKGLALLCFLAASLGSCFDPPEFPAVPEIEFERVEFINSIDPAEEDSLNLYITFRDGDGDLGLSESPEDNSFPYHDVFFYQENNGSLIPLPTASGYIGVNEYDLLLISDASKGTLVTPRSKLKPEYSGLLPSETDFCAPYETLGEKIDPKNPQQSERRRLVIFKSDRKVLDPGIKIVDSLTETGQAQGPIMYYQIMDKLYFTRNPDHFNIDVDFLIKDPTAPDGFREYDFVKELCTTSFDGRFPVFSDKLSSIEGTLKYSMTSIGFVTAFSIKVVKLRVTIKDQARNSSNTVYSNEFTFQ